MFRENVGSSKITMLLWKSGYPLLYLVLRSYLKAKTSMKLPLYYQKATSRPAAAALRNYAGLFDDCQGKLKVQ